MNHGSATSVCQGERSFTVQLEAAHLQYRDAVDNVYGRFGDAWAAAVPQLRAAWEKAITRMTRGDRRDILTQLEWEFSPLLYSAERGDLANEFVPIPRRRPRRSWRGSGTWLPWTSNRPGTLSECDDPRQPLRRMP